MPTQSMKAQRAALVAELETQGIRDPQVSYDGTRVLFSYRPGGTEQYHLYELSLETPRGPGLRPSTNGGGAGPVSSGAGLKQLTSGEVR